MMVGPHLKPHASDDSAHVAAHNERGMTVHFTTHVTARLPSDKSSDVCAVHSQQETVIAVLADGAGSGVPAREAAQRAVEMLAVHYVSRPAAWMPERALTEIVLLLNRTFCGESEARFGRREMVSTLAVAVVEGAMLHGLNAGDSRVWLFRSGTLRQLSKDHTDPADDNCLISGLGITDEPELHHFQVPLADGDVVLLASDGVWKNLMPAEITAALSRQASACSLVAAARGKATAATLDDMSAIVIEVK